MTRSGSATGSGLNRTACAMLKIAVTAPIATARINTTVADNQPPRRTFLDADRKSAASVMGAPCFRKRSHDVPWPLRRLVEVRDGRVRGFARDLPHELRRGEPAR